jgi:NAD(P)-dependent dehydrogenase (short-subunit alcohol dehydrogenase family)
MTTMHVRELFDLSGKVAIVTGGGRGIGLECAEALGEAGAKVLITGRRRQWLDEAEQTLRGAGVEVAILEADVSQPEDARRTVDTAAERFGAIDILVNNAGVAWLAPSLEYPLDKWKMVLDVNLTGAFLMSQAVAPRMIERGGGSIVNMSSLTGQRGLEAELQDTVAYNASKGGLDALTRDLAVKWARHKIRVNAVAPGYFHTRMTSFLVATVEDRMKELSPFQRIGQPGELKGAVVFLASRASDFVTGQILNVDGGASIW